MSGPEDSLIVALDVPSVEQAEALVDRLSSRVTFFKIGLELLFCGGLSLASQLRQRSLRVFIDCKLHDIPRTVSCAARKVAESGANFMTVHAEPECVRSAITATRDTETEVIAVTVLTSQSYQDVRQTVLQRISEAWEEGARAFTVSPQDLLSVRAQFPDAVLFTPGIRAAGTACDDQKRVATPRQAFREGSDFLIMGRPITRSASPLEDVERIIQSMRD